MPGYSPRPPKGLPGVLPPPPIGGSGVFDPGRIYVLEPPDSGTYLRKGPPPAPPEWRNPNTKAEPMSLAWRITILTVSSLLGGFALTGLFLWLLVA